MPDPAYLFREFELVPSQRVLLRGGKPVHLRSRAFDVLVALAERAGKLVSKTELMDLVWPGLAVEENNLTVQLSALRSAMDDGPRDPRIITTVSRRGYRFTAPVQVVERDSPEAFKRHNLPAPLSGLIGRDAALAALELALTRSRLVTILGPGGIGKTRIALATAWLILPGQRDGVWLVELGPHADPSAVPAAIAAALGLHVRPGSTLQDVAQSLRRQHTLLVLDNCEHVIRGAAETVETLLRACPELRVIATSREPLGCDGEAVHRLPPLDVSWPAPSAFGGSNALPSAVTLFVERATSALGVFELLDADVSTAIEICRRVDGIPLAIEMAAGRLRTLGLHAVRARLDDACSILVSGRRTGFPRQQTLRATLDWSFRLLDPADQALMRRLSIFPASFCSAAAAAVAGELPAHAPPAAVEDRLSALVDRSLLGADLQGPEARYTLFETTRQYCAEALSEGDAKHLRREFARWCRDRLRTARASWDTSADLEWTARFGPDIHDVRTVLNDTLVPSADPADCVLVVSLALPLLEQLTLVSEHELWVATALSKVNWATPPQEEARLRLARVQWHTLADPRALRDARAAAALFADAGDRSGQAQALLMSAFAQLSGPNDLSPVLADLDAARRLMARAPRGRLSAQLLRLRGIARWHQGDRLAARGEFDAALEICRDRGFTGLYVRTAGSLAQRQCAEGAFASAEATARQALTLCTGELEWSAPAIHLTGLLASYLVAQGDLRGGAAAARTALSQASARGLRHEFVWGVERCAVCGVDAMPEEAAMLIGYCDESYRKNDRRRLEQSIGRYQASLATIGGIVGPGRLAEAMVAGAALTDQDAIDRAIKLAGLVSG